MSNYTYKGINNKGKNVSGVMDAESDKSARSKLKKLGIFPTELYPEGAKKGGFSLSGDVNIGKFFEKVNVKELALMTRQMATLLGAQVPLVDTLSALYEQTQNPKLKRVLGQIKESVVQGGKLSDAMTQHKDVFSDIYLSMVSAGELSGALETVLKRLADLTEKQAELKSKVKGALMYPLIMSVIGSLLMIFLLIVVVPKVTKIFEDQKKALPLPTEILIGLSHALAAYWYLFALGGVGIYFGVKKFVNTPKGRHLYDQWRLKVPIFGKMGLLVAIARFTRTLATMLASGVQLLKAMDIVKSVMDNSILIQVIESSKNSVKEGESIADTLRGSQYFPPLVTQMIAIGEKTGQLETMLNRIADDYDSQVTTTISTMTTLLEPLMIVVMGGMVSFIVMSILLPILQLNEV